MKRRERIEKALRIAVRFGGIDGDHHKAWVIDQVVRALTDCPVIKQEGVDCHGKIYTYKTMRESKEYSKLVKKAKAGEDGPDTYNWDIGIAP